MRSNPLYAAAAAFCLLAAVSPAAAQTLTPQTVTTEVVDNGTTDKASLYIETDIAKTEVYLNGIYLGLTPLTVDPIKPGLWQLTLKKDGYYQQAYTIHMLAGKLTKIDAALTAVTGTLTVQNAPANAEYEIDGLSVTGSTQELTEGKHELTVRAFGFTEKKTTVTIVRKTETVAEGTLEKAAFAVSALHPLKKAFNPDNPGNLGRAAIIFNVTAPGAGTIRIVGPDGTVVRTAEVGIFTSWRQTFDWDGRDDLGRSVPDGKYQISLTASAAASAASTDKTETRTEIRIDRTVVYPFTDPFSGIGGTGPVVSAALLPKSGMLLHFDCLAAPGIVNPGISALFGLTDRIEAGFRGALLLGGTAENSVDIMGGVKVGLTGGRLKTALSLRYAMSGATIPETSPLFRKGLTAGPAVEYQAGALSIGADAAVGYGNDEGLFSDAVVTGAGGIACRYTSGSLSGALWCQYQTGDTPTAGISFGAATQWLLPGTNLALTGQAGYLMRDAADDVFFARAGFGVLF